MLIFTSRPKPNRTKPKPKRIRTNNFYDLTGFWWEIVWQSLKRILQHSIFCSRCSVCVCVHLAIKYHQIDENLIRVCCCFVDHCKLYTHFVCSHSFCHTSGFLSTFFRFCSFASFVRVKLAITWNRAETSAHLYMLIIRTQNENSNARRAHSEWGWLISWS